MCRISKIIAIDDGLKVFGKIFHLQAKISFSKQVFGYYLSG